MACDSACCGSPKIPSGVTSAASAPAIDRDTGSCCKASRNSVESSTNDCEDKCCQSSQMPPAVEDDDCRDGVVKDTQVMEDTGSPNLDDDIGSTSLQAPDCCEGRPPPCCDSSCIDRIALRECASTKSSKSDNECTRGKDRKACRRHARSAREKYQFQLEAVGCICRALLALGQESCCATARHSSLEKSRPSSRASGFSRASFDSCCAPKAGVCGPPSGIRPESSKGFPVAQVASGADRCCRATKPSNPAAPARCADGCDDRESSAGNSLPSCARACCSEKAMTHDINVVESKVSRPGDPEMGFAEKERVALSITGMTCTGCETKLTRALATIPTISKLKTSLVLSRAEFDLDAGTTSVDEVIKHVERTTEFKCERIANHGSRLEILCQGDPADVVKGDWPDGVLEMKVVGKKIARVDFNAKVVGARDLIEKGWPNPKALAPPCPDPTLDSGAKHVRHVGYMTLLSIVLTIPVLVLEWAPYPEKEKKAVVFGSISLALATVIQFVVAGPFYPKALKALIFSRVIEMDLLIVLSTSAAYIFSVIAFAHLVARNPLSTGQFFETSTLLVTLIMVGRYIAALARQKAVESISIRSMQRSTATIVDKDGVEREIDARLLQYGDVFKVFPESKAPTDGTVISGSSEMDESMLTGESMPVEKLEGSAVVAGSINGSGVLTVRLTRIPDDNTISTIAGMVDEAKLSKPQIQEIADRVATYFVPVVVSLTIVVFCIWIAIGIAVQSKSGSEAAVQAVTYGITVLIVSCPCAIGLAVPMVIVVATGVAAEKGVIFKSANAIETAYKAAHVVFDKTGTLTQGKLTVVREDYPRISCNTKSLLLGLIRSSKHPVSVAVAAHLGAYGVAATTVTDPKNIVSRGVEANIAGCTLRAGNPRWLGLSDDPIVQSILSQGHTAFCFTVDGALAGVFGLADALREDARSTIAKLHQKGISVHVFSGDDEGAVRMVAAQLKIPNSNVRFRCTPTEKQAYIRDIRARFKNDLKEPVIIFCGDGTNDAVALAEATIGVHMNEGSDIAKSAADVVLMRPSLSGIITAITISQKSIHRIAFNFGWSFVYNVFAILLGAGAFVHARIPPEFAGLGELVSVLPVVAAGILLKWAKV